MKYDEKYNRKKEWEQEGFKYIPQSSRVTLNQKGKKREQKKYKIKFRSSLASSP